MEKGDGRQPLTWFAVGAKMFVGGNNLMGLYNVNLVPDFETEVRVSEEILCNIQGAMEIFFQKWAKEEFEAEERRWDGLFAKSPEVLERLADEARAERRAGRTRELDPDLL